MPFSTSEKNGLPMSGSSTRSMARRLAAQRAGVEVDRVAEVRRLALSMRRNVVGDSLPGIAEGPADGGQRHAGEFRDVAHGRRCRCASCGPPPLASAFFRDLVGTIHGPARPRESLDDRP